MFLERGITDKQMKLLDLIKKYKSHIAVAGTTAVIVGGISIADNQQPTVISVPQPTDVSLSVHNLFKSHNYTPR